MWESLPAHVISGRSAAIERKGGKNKLHIELRGAAVRPFVNDTVIDALAGGSLGRRPVSVGLFFDASDAPRRGGVGIRFTHFKVFELGN